VGGRLVDEEDRRLPGALIREVETSVGGISSGIALRYMGVSSDRFVNGNGGGISPSSAGAGWLPASVRLLPSVRVDFVLK